MTSARLRAECLSHPENTVLVTCHLQVDPLESEHPKLCGHAFASMWDYGENKSRCPLTFSRKVHLLILSKLAG